MVFSGGFALFLVVDFVEMDDLRENNPHGKVNQTECGDVARYFHAVLFAEWELK